MNKHELIKMIRSGIKYNKKAEKYSDILLNEMQERVMNGHIPPDMAVHSFLIDKIAELMAEIDELKTGLGNSDKK